MKCLKNFLENVFLWRSPEKYLFFFFFWEIARKIFVKTFILFYFLESTCACVLGPWPWPWPRAFLSLASRLSVLGKAVLGLGLGFFLCPWPWPRALGPRLHLCQWGYLKLGLPHKIGVVSILFYSAVPAIFYFKHDVGASNVIHFNNFYWQPCR